MAAAIIGLVAIAVVGTIASRRARRRQTTAWPDAVELLASSLTLRASIGVGIVGLMTAKPTTTGAALVLVTSIAFGVGLIAARRVRRRAMARRNGPGGPTWKPVR